jgi:transposase-like protein
MTYGIVKLGKLLAVLWHTFTKPSYRGHRFPPAIISYAVWLYPRFCLSLRDVDELLAKRGVTVEDSYGLM